MALSADDIDTAAKFWVKHAFKIAPLPATVDVPTVVQAAGELDGWLDSSPAGDTAPSYKVSAMNSMHAAFTDNVTGAQSALMVAAVTGTVSGVI